MIDLHSMRIPPREPGAPSQRSATSPLAAHLGKPSARYLLIYKAEANRCGKGYDTPLEWTVGGDYRNASCALVLRQATSAHPSGPWKDDARAAGGFFPHAISRPCVEGPSLLQAADGGWLVLFDAYRTDCTLLARRTAAGCAQVGGAPAASYGMQATETANAKKFCAYQTTRRGFGALRSADLAHWTDVSASVSTPADYKHGTAIKLPAQARTTICEQAGGADGVFEAYCRGGELSVASAAV